MAQSKVSVGATSTQVVALNLRRTYLYVCNNTNVEIWMKFGAPAVVGEGFNIKANGGYHSWYQRDFVPEFKGTVNAISESGSNDLAYVELGD